MAYEILPYSFKKATELGVEIKPSKNKNHKIDIYHNGKFITSGGDINYQDYPHYIEDRGLEYANTRRHLYRIRHKKEIDKEGSRGWLINYLLW
jgi:hypothetical protein